MIRWFWTAIRNLFCDVFRCNPRLVFRPEPGRKYPSSYPRDYPEE